MSTGETRSGTCPRAPSSRRCRRLVGPRMHTRRMRYWWASQGKNYMHVAQRGGLWTCPPAGGRFRPDRELIKEIQPHDLVFHYGRNYLRAVSEATASWTPWRRPEHYPKKPGEHDDGWFVRTEPLIRNLEIPRDSLSKVIHHGAPGPLDVTGKPMQKYLSNLRPDDAAGLLHLAGSDAVPAGEHDAETGGRTWSGEHTSMIRETLARQEQSALREHLLRGRSQAKCDLCGQQVPAQLLVAAHIVPRRQLDDIERRNLDCVAMLACTLGCDSLFEHGLIAVDTDGNVQNLAQSAPSDVAIFADRIAGRRCAAHTDATAEKFAEHFARAKHRDATE